jgi:hypothetical protein
MIRRSFRGGMLLLALASLVAGCATMRQQRTQATEELLSAAGFKMRLADTPQKLTHLKTLQPFKLIARSKDNQTVYTYADPEFCKCLYGGGPKEYQAFERLKVQRQEAATELMASEETSMDWALWGQPWW